jgi:hypothetical protein
MHLTVKEALNVGKLKEGKVLAGEKGLDRIVSYVDIMEVPEMGWLRGEELLLTTGYAFKDKPQVLEELVEEMGKVNAAGIIIKANRFLDNIPPKMIEKAELLGIPIIQIPSEIPYIDITHPLLKEIVFRQYKDKYDNEIINEVLNYAFNDSLELKRKLRMIKEGFCISNRFALILIRYDGSNYLKDLIKTQIIKDDPNIISGDIEGNCILICSVNHLEEWNHYVENELLNADLMKAKGDYRAYCIVSRVITDIKDLPIEYKRLYEVSNIIEILPAAARTIYYYDEIVHDFFLSTICRYETAKELVNYVLSPFDEIPQSERDILLETLYEYVKSNGNISKASEKSFMHRNTMKYRIDKIKKIISSPLDTSKELFKYNLVLTLYYLRRNF